MKRLWVLLILLILPGVWLLTDMSLAAQTPQATELDGKPFFIKKSWTIGGEGNWDYLTFDPVALQLYIAHGPTVQVIDVSAGTVAGEVKGLHDAHEIALDSNGQFGYVSDGPSNEVKVFDRRSFEIVASVPTGKNPRAMVFEPASRLVFVICPDTAPESRTPRRTSSGQRVSDSSIQSTVTVIDGDTQKQLANILLPGRLGFAQTDGKGMVYVNVTDRNQIASFNAQEIEARLRKPAAKDASDGTKSDGVKSGASGAGNPTLTVDWSDSTRETQPIPRALHVFRLQECQSPKSLSVDSTNQRIFAACDNMKMQVLNATNGDVLASLPIGAGTDAIGYDPSRGLIYASNGGGVGSLTIIRQHLSDSYAVIQELPTRARARTLAVNPVTGEVYLVTNVAGFDLTHKGGVGDLKPAALAGSFQVLVVGN
jgi:DNA-binding beta-propeller fold protein YncE